MPVSKGELHKAISKADFVLPKQAKKGSFHLLA